MKNIKGIALFDGFSGDELADIERFISVNSYGKDIILFKEGAGGRALYAVKSGEVDILKNFGEPGETVINRIRPGEIFGEMSLFLDAPRNATARVAEETELMLITSVILDNVLRKKPEIAARLLKNLLVLTLKRAVAMDGKIIELENKLRSYS